MAANVEPKRVDVQTLYGELWGVDDTELDTFLKTTLHPRSTDSFYETFASLGVRSDQHVLDIGCRDASHAIRISEQLGCKVTAIDPVPLHLEQATKLVSESACRDRVKVKSGRIESIPLADESVDFIWCRDVMSHVNLMPALKQCYRVLKQGGHMLTYQTFATNGCEPDEFRFLCRALALVPENMARGHFEGSVAGAGFEVEQVDAVGSEWRENAMENGDSEIMTDLMSVARMRRRRDELIERFGRERFEAVYAGSIWGLYQMLGKLKPTVHVLRKPMKAAE